MDSISGYIERITYQSDDNGYTVARLKEPRKRDLTVIVGTMPSVQPGETLRCWGEWRNDTRYGLQFAVARYEVDMPSDELGIKKYLSSGMVKGIGEAFAERIVDVYGAKTLEIIEENPEALLKVNGIGAGRLEKIKACWAEQKRIREVMLFLQQYHVTPTFAQKIFKQYGEASIPKMQANPYDLAKDIFGIGFKTADSIARKMGVANDADIRIDSGIEYVLAELANDGNTCYPIDQFIIAAAELLEVDRDLVDKRLQHVEFADRIVIDTLQPYGEQTLPIACIWLKAFHASEQGIAREVKRLQSVSAEHRIATEELFPALETEGLVLAPQQLEAVQRSLTEPLHLITGGPGTGKSTITKVMVNLFLANKNLPKTDKILLTAPTGRAAKRLAEVTGREAVTIHALLEYNFAIGGFKRGRELPLDCNVLIIDEASMVDTILMYALLKAVPTGAKVIIIGDIDQLPSVGAGAVLNDFIASQTIVVTRLTEIYRQAASSAIITNAHAVNSGKMPDLAVRKDSDFFFIEQDEPEAAATLIADLVERRLPERYGFNPIEDIQVLAPMRIGILGTNALNELLQKRLNPSTEPLTRYGQSFHVRDKVMQLRNNYDKGVYNGDIGRIQHIDRTEQEMTVVFDRKAVTYDFSELDELTLAYACSVHKYQGSECACVIIPVHTSHYRLLFRNLLYTGITRGKKMVVLVGSKKAIGIAVGKRNTKVRYTGLRQALNYVPQEQLVGPLGNIEVLKGL